MPQSRRVGFRCCAPGGKYGISRKYTTFPATTAIRDWTKFCMPALDTGEPEKQQSALSSQHSANFKTLATDQTDFLLNLKNPWLTSLWLNAEC